MVLIDFVRAVQGAKSCWENEERGSENAEAKEKSAKMKSVERLNIFSSLF